MRNSTLGTMFLISVFLLVLNLTSHDPTPGVFWASLALACACVGIFFQRRELKRDRVRFDQQRRYQQRVWREHGFYLPLGWTLDVLPGEDERDWGWPEWTW